VFEHRTEKLLPRRDYLVRQGWSLVSGIALIAVSLVIGMSGYHFLGNLGWVDAFVDASMILSGMGPVSPLTSTAAKIFAGCYALYCGVALLGAVGIIFAPAVHRSLHKFHLEAGRNK
jgi:hypothetical protein